METDYRTFHFDLGVSGSYTGSGKVFGSVGSMLPTDTHVQSGKIQNLTLVFSGSNFNGNLDVIIHDDQVTVGTVGSTYTASFSNIKTVLTVIPISSSNYASIGGHSLATVSGLSTIFNSDSVYISSVYQNGTRSTFQSGSVWATIGYELGESRG